jgi:manganese/zinc/iron transport system permease protein
MIAPPSAAYLLTDRLPRLIMLSVLIGILSAVSGYWVARLLDASIAGSMATLSGVLFFISWMFAPHRGLLALARRRRKQRWEFARTMLTIHLLNHENTSEAFDENHVEHLGSHLRWSNSFSREVITQAERRGLIMLDEKGLLLLTQEGREVARDVAMAE